MKRAVLLLLGLSACGGDEPDRGFAATAGGARQEPYVAVPPGSVARGTSSRVSMLASPGPPLTPELLALGRQVYQGKCASCHGRSGLGDGLVVEKGFTQPPPFAAHPHSAAEIVTIITRGQGAMPAMAEPVPPIERWAVARYLERIYGSAGHGR